MSSHWAAYGLCCLGSGTLSSLCLNWPMGPHPEFLVRPRSWVFGQVRWLCSLGSSSLIGLTVLEWLCQPVCILLAHVRMLAPGCHAVSRISHRSCELPSYGCLPEVAASAVMLRLDGWHHATGVVVKFTAVLSLGSARQAASGGVSCCCAGLSHARCFYGPSCHNKVAAAGVSPGRVLPLHSMKKFSAVV